MTEVHPLQGLRFVVPDRKLSHYCLAPDHPDGGGKAKFFLSRGYVATTLRADLVKSGRSGHVVRTVDTPWGTRLAIRNHVQPPAGAAFDLLTIWQVDRDEPSAARFITAFLD